jgi:hypothetical protein
MLFIALVLSLAAVPPPRAASADIVDACALLTNAEIERIAGAPIVARQPTSEPAGGLLMSQCFFGSSSSRSVSLAVAGDAPGRRAPLTPREYWRRQFHPRERRAEREGERESEARAIGRVGDEAYWAGSRIAGALYVLRGNVFLRISIGGIRDDAERIEKSKALALVALKRLPKSKLFPKRQ